MYRCERHGADEHEGAGFEDHTDGDRERHECTRHYETTPHVVVDGPADAAMDADDDGEREGCECEQVGVVTEEEGNQLVGDARDVGDVFPPLTGTWNIHTHVR